MAIPVQINKKREHTHQFTEVTFTHNTHHKIKVELITGKFGGFAKTKFCLLLDDIEIYSKDLYTLFIQRMKFSFEVEDIKCSIKYFWISGIWYGHIYVDGESAV